MGPTAVRTNFISFQGRMVLDADGLNWLAQYPQSRANWVLTPHPGEAARLLHSTVADIQADRFAAIQGITPSLWWRGIIKGSGTLIFDGKQMAICRR